MIAAARLYLKFDPASLPWTTRQLHTEFLQNNGYEGATMLANTPDEVAEVSRGFH